MSSIRKIKNRPDKQFFGRQEGAGAIGLWFGVALLLGIIPVHPIARQTSTGQPVTIAGRQDAPKPPGSRRPARGQATEEPGGSRPAVGQIKGQVLDDGGRPIVGATVMVIPASAASHPTTLASSMQPPTNAEGRFVAKNLAPGSYSIGVNVEGYVAASDGGPRYYRPGDSVTITVVKGGIITGKVTDSEGGPVVGARVRAIRVTNWKARRASESEFLDPIRMMRSMTDEWETDDRGVYRIYGLEPGSYQVAAGGEAPLQLGSGGAYDGDAPTYYPSTAADAATEVVVELGQEVTGIDITYRGGSGHSISGRIIGEARPGVGVVLFSASTGAMEEIVVPKPDSSNQAFVFRRIADGEYDVLGMAESAGEAASAPRRVTVKGADVTGLELSLQPFASITGAAALERISEVSSEADCKSKHRGVVEETVLRLERERDEKAGEEASPANVFVLMSQVGAPDAKGEFKLRCLAGGRKRIEVELQNEDWYVRAITRVGAPDGRKPMDVGRDGIAIKTGEKVTGVTIAISEGAATLRGRVVAELKPPPASRLRVFLVPASKERADDVLRYGEANVESDGSFVLKNLGPGSYWLVARAVPDSEFKSGTPTPAAWDKAKKAGLRTEGALLNAPIELTPCGRVNDYTLRYKPAAVPSKPAS